MTDLADSHSAVGVLQRTTLDLRSNFEIAYRTLERDAAWVGDNVEQALRLVRGIGWLMTGLADIFAIRFAERGGDADPNAFYDQAQQVVDELGDEPVGIETAGDPEYFARMKRCAASILARFWLTGYLLGPIPIDAWPNETLARQLLTTIEHHADVITLLHDVASDDDQP
ncbi:hypothetical protein [Amycolatopsis sp. FDAARGOS 1241]|uniref:hypothetical protein n=1 Tax=Amycolatopsis sp. FDAARGOS 1241 TaxID=2778070 RepID=UPI001950409C|nr:hypothetical protein [Amycolatopsis sp. FDAARGOS 1241]QRP42956.1 hypothetical protein I6J71_26280 [Amycolatopsis sp. FDAARGOS 1241]